MARFIRYTPDHVVLDPEGQNLQTIAEDWTLSPGYALAIANYNSMDPGYYVDSGAPVGTVVAIPWNWIKPTIAQAVAMAPNTDATGNPLKISITGFGTGSTVPAGQSSSAGPDWLLYGALGLLAAAVLLS